MCVGGLRETDALNGVQRLTRLPDRQHFDGDGGDDP